VRNSTGELQRLKRGVNRHGIGWLLIDSHRQARQLKDLSLTAREATQLHRDALANAIDDIVTSIEEATLIEAKHEKRKKQLDCSQSPAAKTGTGHGC